MRVIMDGDRSYVTVGKNKMLAGSMGLTTYNNKTNKGILKKDFESIYFSTTSSNHL